MKKLILTIAVFSFITFISCKEKTQGQTKSSIVEKENKREKIESSTKERKLEKSTEKENRQPAESVEISTIKNVVSANNKVENAINYPAIKTVSFEGIKVGDTFMDHSDKFKRENEENSESTFKGYQIMDKDAKVIGFAHANSSDKSRIGKIEITNPNYKTNEGIGIGNTFQEVNNAYKNIQLVRNKNTVIAQNYKLIFDNDTVNENSKIKTIIIEK